MGWTAPGGQNAVSISYQLPAGTFSGTDRDSLRYLLQAEPQSLWTPSTVTVQVTAPAGWTPVPQGGQDVSGSTATVSAVQSAPVNVVMNFER